MNKVYALVAVVALALAGVWYDHHQSAALARAEEQVRVAHDSLAVVQKAVAKTLARADSVEAAAAKLAADAESARASAMLAKKDSDRLIAKFHHDSSYASADSALDNARIVVASLSVAVDKQTQRGDSLKASLDSALLTLARLNTAATQVDVAAHAVETAAKPSFFAKLLPRPGIGAAAGVDVYGKPNAVVGITLTWSVF